MSITKKQKTIFITITVLSLISLFFAVGLGPTLFSPPAVAKSIAMHLGGSEYYEGCGISILEYNMIWKMRVPRVLLGFIVGAVLAVCGITMQALVRNNLADPFILGVSSGASAFASMFMVFGFFSFFGRYSLPLSAFLGALVSIVFVYYISRVNGRINIPQLLLAGVAVAMIMDAVVSFINEMAPDIFALHNVDFWLSGSLAGAKWDYLTIPLVIMILCMGYLMISYRSLNALVMGEEVAGTLGIRVSSLQKSLVLAASLMAGAAISVSGSIGFVGMMMPHIARMLLGPDHKKVLPVSALFGGVLVVWADVVARTIVAPEEMPVGIVTALVGAPFFVVILRREVSSNSSLKMD